MPDFDLLVHMALARREALEDEIRRLDELIDTDHALRERAERAASTPVRGAQIIPFRAPGIISMNSRSRG